MGVLGEVISVNKLFQNFGDLDTDVLQAVTRGSKVEFLNVEGTKFCALLGEDAVEKKLENI